MTSECSYEVKMALGKKGPSRNAQTSSRIRAPTADQRDSNEDVDVGLPSIGVTFSNDYLKINYHSLF